MKRDSDKRATRVPDRTTSVGMARYAREFLEAAVALDDVIGDKQEYFPMPSVPVLYLAAHSIELGLKSFLLHEGKSLDELREFGHNLEKCLDTANQLNLSQLVIFESREIAALEALNELYSTKQLNYISTGTKRYPVLEPVKAFGCKLLDSICPHVGYR